MITNTKIGGQIVTKTAEFFGLTSDVSNLPTENVPNASTFYDMQTGNVYMFDEENTIWILQ